MPNKNLVTKDSSESDADGFCYVVLLTSQTSRQGDIESKSRGLSIGLLKLVRKGELD